MCDSFTQPVFLRVEIAGVLLVAEEDGVSQFMLEEASQPFVVGEINSEIDEIRMVADGAVRVKVFTPGQSFEGDGSDIFLGDHFPEMGRKKQAQALIAVQVEDRSESAFHAGDDFLIQQGDDPVSVLAQVE